MRRPRERLALGGLGLTIAVVTGCLRQPAAPQAPTPAPDADNRGSFTITGSAAVAASARLAIDAAATLHPASPFVVSFNRNHVHRQFEKRQADRQAMIAATRQLRPRWGSAYLAGLRAAGYPADAGRPYLYRTGHGPTDGRTDYKLMDGYLFWQCWGLDGRNDNWDGYPYDDVRYTLQEASDMGAQLLVTLNFGSDTAASAGALAGYLNAPASPLRSQYPLGAAPFHMANDQPVGAYMFEVGNEVQLPVVRGHERARSIAQYVGEAAPYIRAARAAQPFPIKVALAAAVNVFWGGPNLKEASWRQQDGMITAFIEEAVKQGVTFDALQYHGYPAYPVREHLAGNAYAEQLITKRLMPMLAAAPFPIEIWNDEHHAAESGPRNTGLYGALYQADATVLALSLSLNGRQLMPVTTDFAWWHAGAENNGDSLYFQDNDAAKTTPIFQFRRLLAEHFGDYVVPTRLAGGGAWVDHGQNGEETRVSNLHAVASRSADGHRLELVVVNRSATQDETLALALNGFTPASGRVSVRRIEAVGAAPWEARWDQTRISEQTVEWGAALRLPAGTISFVTIE